MKGKNGELMNMIIGFLSGAVIVLVIIVITLLMSSNSPEAFAQSVSGDGSNEGFVLGAMTTQSGWSYIIVLHQRPMDDIGIKNLDVPEGHTLNKRVTLSLYKVGVTGLGLDHAGSRDITYDTQMISIPSPASQALADVKKYYSDMVKRAQEKK
jgi:hypothetical protein